MKTTIQEQDGKMVVILEGSLDTASAPETEEAMAPLNDVETKDIILDCTRLDYISSAGLRIFLASFRMPKRKVDMFTFKTLPKKYAPSSRLPVSAISLSSSKR